MKRPRNRFWEIIKGKKSDKHDFQGGVNFSTRYNHPNRLTTVSVAGSLSYTIDERDFTSPGTLAYKYDFSLDFSLAESYSRLMETFYPWFTVGSEPTQPDAGEFNLSHRPLNRFWEFGFNYEPSDVVTIGTVTRTPYTRPTLLDAWTAGTPVDTDMDFAFDFDISGGGEPDSGGKGDDSDDERAVFAFTDFFDGTYFDKLPDFDTSEIYQLPWNDTWTDESAIFASIFSDHIDARNTADGGGHSGSCSLGVVFT